MNFPPPLGKHALVRCMPESTFHQCVCDHADPDTAPIDVPLALKQWQCYTDTLRDHGVQVPSDAKHPDCCFVEDTCVVVGDTAVVNRLGHPSRRGEVIGMHEALKQQSMAIKRIVEMKEPATLDGGDVLYTGRHIFVGQSQRSNAEGIETLRQVFAPIPVVGLPMPKTVLHLKCLISLWHGDRLFIADTPAGRELWASFTADYEAVWVPDMLTANVLSLPHSKTMLIQNVRNDSVQKLTELARAEGWKAVVMDMSETVKADGALTCLSVLFGQ